MWQTLKQALLDFRALGISHEALIEIMIALLGVMITVLAILIGVFGFFGWKSIKDEAIKRAIRHAEVVAKKTAETAISDAMDEQLAAAYSEAQKEVRRKKPKQSSGAVPKMSSTGRAVERIRKATSDSNLKREDRQ